MNPAITAMNAAVTAATATPVTTGSDIITLVYLGAVVGLAAWMLYKLRS